MTTHLPPLIVEVLNHVSGTGLASKLLTGEGCSTPSTTIVEYSSHSPAIGDSKPAIDIRVRTQSSTCRRFNGHEPVVYDVPSVNSRVQNTCMPLRVALTMSC
jgi:hypothetical protein